MQDGGPPAARDSGTPGSNDGASGSGDGASGPADDGGGASTSGPITMRLLSDQCHVHYPEPRWRTLEPVVPPSEDPGWITQDGTRLLVLCGDTLGLLPLAGGAVDEVATYQTDPRIVLLGADHVVYLEDGRLLSAAFDGREPIPLELEPFGRIHLTRDGKRVFYGIDRGDGTVDLMSIDTAGSEPQLVVGGSVTTGFDFVLTPDDGHVIIRSGTGNPLGVAPAAGGTPVPLGMIVPAQGDPGLGSYVELSMALAHDGQRFAFVDYNGGDERLIVSNLDGSTVEDSGPFDTGNLRLLQFLPDDERVLVVYSGTNAHAYIGIGSPGGNPPVPVGDGDFAVLVGVDAAGERVAFIARDGSTDPILMVGTTDGGEPVALSTLDRCNSGFSPPPAIAASPDGAHVLYIDTLGNLNLVDLAAREETVLATDVNRVGDSCNAAVAWSPDSSMIAYSQCADSCEHVIVATPSGKELLSIPIQGTALPKWFFSPDSKHLVVIERESLRIFRADDDIQLEVPLYGQAITYGFVDATRFVYGIRTEGTFLVDLGG